jgi:transketolase N-terminal domain/subunit
VTAVRISVAAGVVAAAWRAALAGAHHGLGNLLCIVDVNKLQADGYTAGVLRTEPVSTDRIVSSTREWLSG